MNGLRARPHSEVREKASWSVTGGGLASTVQDEAPSFRESQWLSMDGKVLTAAES